MKITFFSILAIQVFLHNVITYAHPNRNAEASTAASVLLTLDHNTRIDSLLQTAITQTILQQYDKALELTELVIKSTPSEPTGYFFKAAILQARMMDYENYEHDEKAFFFATATCRKLAQAKLKERHDQAWAHFFYGSAMGYEAFLLGKKKKFLEAFRYGWQSLQHLEAALKINPQLHDAYLGIGTYKYYRSKMSKTFSWLPFVKDEREEGILMIRQAIAHGRYSRTAAINGLSWILINENRSAEALALIDSALIMYPASRFFLWSAGEAAYRAKRYDQAAAYYRLILSSLQNENRLSPYLELAGRTRLAKAYQAAGKAEEACREFERIGVLNLSKRDRERGEEFLQEAAKQRHKCEEATNGKSRMMQQK
jgi:tetratricopeptide (TPR) repeat protein